MAVGGAGPLAAVGGRPPSPLGAPAGRGALREPGSWAPGIYFAVEVLQGLTRYVLRAYSPQWR